MSNRTTYIITAILLIFVFLVALFSMKGDSLTMDEVSHLPAGYSYLTQRDMRINPEHPPLIKDLAAIPLLFIEGIKFPYEIEAWKEDINGQWDFGFHFMYKTGNPADEMIFWGRIPMILILVLLGFYIFKWTRELFGNNAGLLALLLFSFSPTFLTHGRLVTTDVGAAAGVFISLYYFVKFLKNSSWKNLIIAGITLALAQLAKFSAIFLLPLFGILILVWSIVKASSFKSFWKQFGVYIGKLIIILLIVFVVISLLYSYHVWDYPLDRHIRDIQALHQGRAVPIIGEILNIFSPLKKVLGPLGDYLTDLPKTLIALTKTSIFRPFAQYLTGLSLVIQRGSGGHTTFFMGEISAGGWKDYFPIVYIIKAPLAFHILTILSLLYAAWLIEKPFWINPSQRSLNWLKEHFPEFAMIGFMVIYWAASLASPLNIGVRHLLPVFPFAFLLVSGVITSWMKLPPFGIKYLIVVILIIWQIISVTLIYPHFLSYFNEIVGGPEKGHLYTVDSNLDWGQDLKRLTQWVNEKGIDKIYVDYFGGGDAKFYLKEKNTPWWGTRDPAELQKGNYLAVSVTLLQGGRGEPTPGFDQPTGYYRWLYKYEPIEKIGNSIFVYYID
jgi:4-amino-4-deoxy-L-arabinose transferase-like glycosyltransferase